MEIKISIGFLVANKEGRGISRFKFARSDSIALSLMPCALGHYCFIIPDVYGAFHSAFSGTFILSRAWFTNLTTVKSRFDPFIGDYSIGI